MLFFHKAAPNMIKPVPRKRTDDGSGTEDNCLECMPCNEMLQPVMSLNCVPPFTVPVSIPVKSSTWPLGCCAEALYTAGVLTKEKVMLPLAAPLKVGWTTPP